MIDTTSIPDLFRYLVIDLEAGGNVLRSSDSETQRLLDQEKSSQPDAGVDLELDFSVDEFASTIRTLGNGAEFMWPGSTTESAGLRLLLTHLDEQRASTNAPSPGPVKLTLHDSEPQLIPAL